MVAKPPQCWGGGCEERFCSCLCCPSAGPASAAVGLPGLIVVIQINKCLGEQRGSFSPDQFPSAAHKMTAETAVTHGHGRQGQQGCCSMWWKLPTPAPLPKMKFGVNWIYQMWLKELSKQVSPEFMIVLVHKHFQHFFAFIFLCYFSPAFDCW